MRRSIPAAPRGLKKALRKAPEKAPEKALEKALRPARPATDCTLAKIPAFAIVRTASMRA